MTPRYGILIQTTQLLAQLFLDWCTARDVHHEPFTFTVPGECISGLDPEYTGVLVTISPVRKPTIQVNLTELSVVQAVRSTIGNKKWKPPG